MPPLRFDMLAWIAWAIGWFAAGLFVNRTRAAEGKLIRLQHLLPIAVGFVLILHDRHRPLLVGRLYESPIIEWVGAAITVAGMAFAVWARVHLGRYWSGVITLKEGHRLIRTGPYRLARHPIYTGFLAAVLGTASTASTGDAFIGAAMILIAYLIKIRREERVLAGEFGEEYALFRREVAALVPMLY
jgi:protein-S-isoprenylcysteine O-methyltransferase Ste14